MQLDQPERGFGYRVDGPLDMRMGDEGPSAADLVNGLSEGELADLIYEYGEEHRSRRVAHAIVRNRPDHHHRSARPRGRRRAGTASGGPPPRASHVPGAAYRGQPGARGARRLPASGGRPPRSRWPRGRDRVPLVRGPHREARPARGRRGCAILTKKPQRPDPDEVARNPRARSALLRAAERVEEAA